MPDTITIPAPRMGMQDATLEVEYDGMADHYSMTLRDHTGHIIAAANGFRPGAGKDFGDHRPGMTAGTFGAFLAHALEDPEARVEWAVISEDASDWTDVLAIMEEDLPE